jgi:hypothetical protein
MNYDALSTQSYCLQHSYEVVIAEVEVEIMEVL